MGKFRVEFKSVTPCLMHSSRGLDKTSDLAREIIAITDKKKNKTEQDLLQLSRLEWEMGFYFDAQLGPYWPAENIESLLFKGAQKSSKGPKAKIGLTVLEDKVPLLYEGPRTLDALWKSGKFTDVRPVVINRNRIMRTRPIFHEWELKFTLLVDEKQLSESATRDILQAAGEQIGLSDNRPRFGRFDVVRFE